MSNTDLAVTEGASPKYRQWLRRERSGRLNVRLAQLALLLVVLVLWEILPRAQIVNPLFTSYPSAIWPTFLDMLKTTPQQRVTRTNRPAGSPASAPGSAMRMISGSVQD